jgi:hypothetical protein
VAPGRSDTDEVAIGGAAGSTAAGRSAPAIRETLDPTGRRSAQVMVNEAVIVAAELSPATRSISPGSTTKAPLLS